MQERIIADIAGVAGFALTSVSFPGARALPIFLERGNALDQIGKHDRLMLMEKMETHHRPA